MSHFFAAEKMLHTHSLKEATATCSLTRLKDFPKLLTCSGSSRILGFTAARHHQCPNNPRSVLLTTRTKMLYLQAICPKLANPWKQKPRPVLCYLALLNVMDRRKTQQSERQQHRKQQREGGSPSDSHRRQLEQVRPARDSR